jgi:hypothetical protein
MNRLVLFNGPPRSGKDTAVECFQDIDWDISSFKFAQPLHDNARMTIFPLVGENRYMYYSEEAKNEIILELGVSYRDFCIKLSEEYYKPNFGKDIFGRIQAGYIKHIIESTQWERNIFACSDSGFVDEVRPVIEVIGAENVMLVHLYRDGCSFIGDSRNYVDLSDFGIKPWEVHNTDIKLYYEKIEYLYDQLTAPCLPPPEVL